MEFVTDNLGNPVTCGDDHTNGMLIPVGSPIPAGTTVQAVNGIGEGIPIFQAPIDLREGDTVSVNVLTGKPLEIARGGKVIWPDKQGNK